MKRAERELFLDLASSFALFAGGFSPNGTSEIVSWTRKKGLMFLGKRRATCYFYVNLLPLLEILAQVRNVGLSRKKVINDYNNLTVLLGAEREIMLRRKPEEIKRAGGVKLKEVVLRVREGKILIKPGFDG
ncbi:MAG: hypothetical protein ACOX5S_02445 [Patescibacteria group bacterium]|jgi:PHP family Zn ribbon phosphoesterase